jgi:ArsR family metal-binding transcriptional regulator
MKKLDRKNEKNTVFESQDQKINQYIIQIQLHPCVSKGSKLIQSNCKQSSETKCSSWLGKGRETG